MDFSAPHTAVTPRVDGQILLALARTTRPLSGREVARLAEVSANSTNLVLRRLSEHGLVDVQEAGRGAVLLYTLNRDHVAAEVVLTLASLRSRFLDRLREAFASWPIPPVHASMFGSAARGDGDARSDIDLFVVRPTGVDEDDDQWRAQINQLAEGVRHWSGNHAGIAESSVADVRRLKRERPPVVSELEKDGIVLAGKSFAQLFGKRMK